MLTISIKRQELLNKHTAEELVIGQTYLVNDILEPFILTVVQNNSSLPANECFDFSCFSPSHPKNLTLYDIVTNTVQYNELWSGTVSTAALIYKGIINASTNPDYPAGSQGDVYVFSVAGRIGGASGEEVDAGDLLICNADNAGGTEAAVGTAWDVVEHNFTDERIDDRVAVLIQNGTGLTWTYNDPLNTLTGNVLQATELIFGGAEIATQVETNAGLLDDKIISPLKLAGSAFAYDLGFINDKGIKSSVTATHQFTPKESASGGIMFGTNGINFNEGWFWGHKTDGASFGWNTTSVQIDAGGANIYTNFPGSTRGWFYQNSTGKLSLGATGLFTSSLATAAAVNIIGIGNTAGTSALQIHNSDLTRFLQVQNNGNYIFNSDNVQFQTLASVSMLFLSAAAANAVFNVPIIPNADNSYDIGTSGARWKDLYLSNIVSIKNGIVPVADSADIFQMYSADITAGNATAHIRTEAGDIIRLFAVGGWGTPAGTLTRTTFNTTTATLTEVAERLAALISDLKTQQNFLKA